MCEPGMASDFDDVEELERLRTLYSLFYEEDLELAHMGLEDYAKLLAAEEKGELGAGVVHLAGDNPAS
jgi:hypothetical protein